MQLLLLALCLVPALTPVVQGRLESVPKRDHLASSFAGSHRDLSHKLVARDQIKKRCRVKPSGSGSNPPTTTTPAGNGNNGGSGGSSSTRTSTPTTTPVNTGPVGNSDYALKYSHEGSNFFDGWDFWSYGDPTHGDVEYVTRDVAQSQNLIRINDQGNAIMRVETTQNVGGGNRKSVRIHDQYSFNGGLLIMDSVHMPVGCGTWPAFWTNGPDWPNKGEIDILEGVHDGDINQSSIHTGSGCRIPENDYGASGSLVGGPNCASYETGNSGCGMMNSGTSNNYGARFNNNGGGVYAMLWDHTGIMIYFFPRGAIPADIDNKAPRPQDWGTPAAKWPASQCDPYKYFVDNFAIFDTTLCGDWAGNTWNSPQPSGQSCAQSTGYSSCTQFVKEQGDKFNNAYWEVKNVRFYQTK